MPARQADAAHAAGDQDLGGLLVVPAVDRQPQPEVGLHGVVALVLQDVCPKLLDQPHPASLMAGDIQQQPPAFGGDPPHGQPELRAAVAAERPEGVAGEAAGVQAEQDTAAVSDVPTGEQEVQVARSPLEGAKVELPGPGGQGEAGNLLGRREHRASYHLPVGT